MISDLFAALGIDLPTTGTVIEPRTVIVGLVLGTVIAVVSGLAPALRATRVPPVTGLRDGVVPATTARAPSAHRRRGRARRRSAPRRWRSGSSAR